MKIAPHTFKPVWNKNRTTLRYSPKQLGDIARARGMMQLAKDTGLTREGLYKSLSEQGNPSLSTVMKVMHALGLQMNIGPQLSAG